MNTLYLFHKNKDINFDSLSYATSTLKLLNQKELLIETMK